MEIHTGLRKSYFTDERNFGFLIGSIAVVIGGWWVWREKFGFVAPLLLSIGVVLILLGATFPRYLHLPYTLWMKLAAMLSLISTPVILGIVFFFVMMPVGLVKRLSGWDPLGRRRGRAASYWKPYSLRQRDPRHYERLF